jgi:hypothetical protein
MTMTKAQMALALANEPLARTWNNFRLPLQTRVARYMRMRRAELQAIFEKHCAR